LGPADDGGVAALEPELDQLDSGGAADPDGFDLA
jgi:hypothetical protein